MDLRTLVARVIAPLSIALLGACADDAAKTDTSNPSDATEATEAEAALGTTAAAEAARAQARVEWIGGPMTLKLA